MRNKLSTAAESKSGSTSLSQEQKSEAAVTHTHQHWTDEDWENEPGLMNLFLLRLQMVGSEFGINSMNPWTRPALCQQSRLVVV